MNYTVMGNSCKKYIDCAAADTPLCAEQDALKLITACIENKTNLLMLHDKVLSDDFFNLKTGLAGLIMQKFVNYHIKTSLVIMDERKIQGKFKDLLVELNKGNDFRAFASVDEAEKWLLSLE